MMLSLLLAVSLLFNFAASQKVTIQFDGAQALILVDNVAWLHSGDVWFHAQNTYYSTADQSLKLTKTENVPGIDANGKYQATRHSWQSSDASLSWQTAYRVYMEDAPNDQSIKAIVFEQTWITGSNDTAVDTNNAMDTVLSSFPTFDPSKSSPRTLGAHQYAEIMMMSHAFVWSGDKAKLNLQRGRDGGPITLFDGDKPSLVSVFSPFSEFMATSTVNVNGSMCTGVMGSMTSVPAGYHSESIIVFGSAGVTSGLLKYGDIMLQRYDKTRSAAYTQPTTQYLIFSTDNGGYYYYNTEKGMNYEQTLELVMDSARKSSIPYHGMLLDSWWYYKDQTGAVLNWTARPDIFPSGLPKFSSVVQIPFIAHNRYWSPHSQYAKQNGGKYDWAISGDYSLPTSQDFWSDLFANNSDWNLRVYEQDWLQTCQDNVVFLSTDIKIGRQWLMQMGSGAARNALEIQYCMPYPRHMLQSVEIPAVTQIRGSYDNVPGDIRNLYVGETSLLSYALGVAAFKDGFWTTSVQPGAPDNWKEPSPGLHAVVATLTMGPVAPADKYDLSNITLLSRSHRADGLILKPDRPAFSLDASYYQRAFGTNGPDAKQITTTYSSHIGYQWHVVVVMMESTAYKLTTADVFSQNTNYLAHSWQGGALHMDFVTFNDNTPLPVAPNSQENDFVVWYLTPIIVPGFVLLGETSKWVPLSAQRVTNMQLTQANVVLSLIGDANEIVTIQWASLSSEHSSMYDQEAAAQWVTASATCVLNDAGAATLTIGLSSGNQWNCQT